MCLDKHVMWGFLIEAHHKVFTLVLSCSQIVLESLSTFLHA